MVIAQLALALALARPANAGVSIPDITQVTDLTGPAISPDARFVVFRTEQASIASNGYRLTWYVAPLDRSTPPRPIGDGGDAQYTDAGLVAWQTPIWAPRSDAIYYRALIDGEVQIWRAPVDGGDATALTHDASNIRDAVLAVDGRSLIYHVGASRELHEDAERHADDDGVLIDGSVDPALPLSRGSFIDGKPASARFIGQWFDRGDILWNAPLREERVAIPRKDTQASGSVPPLGTVTITRNSLAHSVLRLTTIGQPDRVCTLPLCQNDRVDSAIPLGDGRSMLVTTSDRTRRQTLSIWQPNSGAGRRLAMGDGLLNGHHEDIGEPCAASPLRVVCVEASAAGPPRIVSFDVKTAKRTLLFDPNAGLRQRIGYPVRALSWLGTDGTPFTGILVLPQAAAPRSGYPLVMNYYDCAGFLRGGEGDELPIYPLADAGIATLCINKARFHTADPSRDQEYGTAIGGIEAVVDRLAREGLVDRTRLGMSGLSYGSEIVMAVIERTRLLRAAAISTVQEEPSLYWFNTVAGRDVAAQMRASFGVGDPDSDAAGWKAIAPVRNLDRLKTPLLMQLPENEMRLSMELYSKLSNTQTPVELYGFSNETHVKRQPRHKLAVYQRNLDWFRFWLLGTEDASPEKAEQYRRWRRFSARPGYALPIADRLDP